MLVLWATLLVLWGTERYYGVVGGTLGYFERYFGVLFVTLGYFVVLCGTLGTFEYFEVLWRTLRNFLVL